MKYPAKTAVILSILLASAFCAAAAPQAAAIPQPTTGIFGRVVNAETHEPVRRAAVKVYTSKEQWDEFTDSEGRFRFPSLARDEYTLIAHRDGYTDRSYTVERSDFDDRKELPVELRPQAVITGRVVDRLGQALSSAQIQALGPQTRGGKFEVIASARTNDLGEYRLAGLDPRTYRLRAEYREGRANEFDPTPLTKASAWHGGAEKPAEFAVKAGSVTTGIDFILNPVRPATIRGTLHAEPGILTEPVSLSIMGHAGEGGQRGSCKDGKFEISDVGPGTYTITAETSNETAPAFGIAMIEVHDTDVDALDLVLRPTPIIHVEVRMEGGDSVDLKPGSFYFTSTEPTAPGSPRVGHPDKDQRFTVALIPGEYVLTINASITRLGVRLVTFDGKAVTSRKLQIDESPEAKKLVIVVGSKAQP